MIDSLVQALPFIARGLDLSQALRIWFGGVGFLFLLFLLRPRPVQLKVSSSYLWDQVLPRQIPPLWKDLIALILQILLLTSLLLALADPAPREAVLAEGADTWRARDTVVVIDLSVSMRARPEPGSPSRLDTVRAQLLALVEELAESEPGERPPTVVGGLALEAEEGALPELPEGDRIALVAAGAEPSLLVPFTADRARLRLAIQSLAAEGDRADLTGAIDLAGTVLEEAVVADRDTRAVLFSDADLAGSGAPPPSELAGAPLAIIPAGDPLPNVAILSFEVEGSRGLPPEVEAFARVRNFADEPATFVLSLETDQAALGRVSYTLGPGEELTRAYRFDPRREEHIELHVRDVAFASGATDALPDDNQAYRFLPLVRPARALLVSRGNRFLRAALAAVPGLRVSTVTPDNFTARQARGFDIVFYDRVAPANAPDDVDAFYFDPHGPHAPWPILRAIPDPSLTAWDLGHPLFADLILRDLTVEEAFLMGASEGDSQLIATPSGPIALARQERRRKVVAWGFDPARSDLPLRVGFPQLIFNAVLWAREGDAVIDRSELVHRMADPFLLRAPAGQQDARAQVMPLSLAKLLAEGEELSRDQRRALRELDLADGDYRLHFPRPGFYQLVGSEPAGTVAANLLDPVESDLSAVSGARLERAGLSPRGARPSPAAAGLSPWWLALALTAGLGLSLLEYGVATR